MANQGMSADEISHAVMVLEQTAQVKQTRDIIDELRSGWTRDEDEDTWEAGFLAAIAVIDNNFRTEY
jgi:hypothetical protein